MGKKERLKFREKWKTTWSIEKKMQTVILAVIIGMTVIAICVSIIFSIDTLTEQSQEYSAERLQTMAAEYDSNLRQYKSVMTSIVLDESVQQYCENIRQEETNALAGNVYSTLQNMMIRSNMFIMEMSACQRAILKLYIRKIIKTAARRKEQIILFLVFQIITIEEKGIP